MCVISVVQFAEHTMAQLNAFKFCLNILSNIVKNDLSFHWRTNPQKWDCQLQESEQIYMPFVNIPLVNLYFAVDETILNGCLQAQIKNMLLKIYRDNILLYVRFTKIKSRLLWSMQTRIQVYFFVSISRWQLQFNWSMP